MKKPLFEPIEIRSPEVQEIMGKIPNSLVRWGVTVIFLVILALLLISWFIQYPDLLTAKVVITSNPPPVTLVSRNSGKLTLLLKENEAIQPGYLIGYLQSNASPVDVLEVEKAILNNAQSLLSYSLGEIQNYYTTYLAAVQEQAWLTNTLPYDKQVEQLNKQIATQTKIGISISKQQRLIREEVKLALQKFKTDSLLYTQKVTATLDFNQAKTAWLQQQRSARNAEDARLNHEAQLNGLNKQITDLELQKAERLQKVTLAANQTREELLGQINQWKEAYLFIAPINGTLSYLGFLENELHIEAGKSLFTVLPEKGNIIARAELPIKGSGKVKVGQRVTIKLDNFPFEQYGMLKGAISSISSVPGEDSYWIMIELPEELITNQKRYIPFKQQLSGVTEIITEDLTLLERFTYPLKKLIQPR